MQLPDKLKGMAVYNVAQSNNYCLQINLLLAINFQFLYLAKISLTAQCSGLSVS